MKIRTVDDLVSYLMNNNIDGDREITIGVEGYHTYDEDACIEDRELNIEVLPNGNLLISDNADYSELKVVEQEYGFEVTETRRRYVKVTAKDYDTAVDMIDKAVRNNNLDMDNESYIEDSDFDDYDNIDNCDDVTDEIS